MARKTISFERFWKELKRRKVFSVVTTYAATAYIIIEVVNNLIGPLHLPDWLASLVVTLLIIGLPVVIILSWIFDFTPQGIKKTESLEKLEGKEFAVKPVKRKLRASYVLNAVLIIAVLILAYPKIFKRDTLERLRSSGERISVAVMPFQNMTNDTTWNVWQDGIQDNLITALSTSEELEVRQRESITTFFKSKGLSNYASITPSFASKISRKLEANVLACGSISQAGDIIRINAQLIDSKTERVLKSFQLNGTPENILYVVDSLSKKIKDILIITNLGKDINPDQRYTISTNSPEAYRYYILGEYAFHDNDFQTAIKLYSQALSIDTNFYLADRKISAAYLSIGNFEGAKKSCLRVYRKLDHLPIQEKIWTNWLYSLIFETPFEQIKYLKQLQKFDDQMLSAYSILGQVYSMMYQYNNAIPEFEKVIELYNKWDVKPIWPFNYVNLVEAYYNTGQYKKEKKLLKIAEKDFPNDFDIIVQQAIMYINEGDTVMANQYLEKIKSKFKEDSQPEVNILSYLGQIFSEGKNFEKAEECYRKALSLEPNSGFCIAQLAIFLVEYDRNINEGLELLEKELKIHPDYYLYLDTKGWGLYKQGKYKEALEVLEKSWELKPLYIHDIYLHLEAAKKAVAGLKHN